jgi:hypothetical protein
MFCRSSRAENRCDPLDSTVSRMGHLLGYARVSTTPYAISSTPSPGWPTTASDSGAPGGHRHHHPGRQARLPCLCRPGRVRTRPHPRTHGRWAGRGSGPRPPRWPAVGAERPQAPGGAGVGRQPHLVRSRGSTPLRRCLPGRSCHDPGGMPRSLAMARRWHAGHSAHPWTCNRPGVGPGLSCWFVVEPPGRGRAALRRGQGPGQGPAQALRAARAARTRAFPPDRGQGRGRLRGRDRRRVAGIGPGTEPSAGPLTAGQDPAGVPDGHRCPCPPNSFGRSARGATARVCPRQARPDLLHPGRPGGTRLPVARCGM